MIDLQLDWDIPSIVHKTESAVSPQLPLLPAPPRALSPGYASANFAGNGVILSDITIGDHIWSQNCTITNQSSVSIMARSSRNLATHELIGVSPYKFISSSWDGLPLGPGSSVSLGVVDARLQYSKVQPVVHVTLRGPSLTFKATEIVSATPIQVRLECLAEIHDENRQRRISYSVKGNATGTVVPQTNVAIDMPSSLDFGAIPLGGTAYRELPITLRSDGPYNGSLNYSAENPAGMIGPGQLRLAYGAGHTATGYADLSGNKWIPISGGRGDKMLGQRVYLNSPANGQLGFYRTKLRVTLRYN